MSAEPSQLVSYHCPNCQAALRRRADRPDSWLRCPRCGRASRASWPPVVLVPRASGAAPDSTPESSTIAAPECEPASPATQALAAALARREAMPAPARDWRILYASGLFVAVTMLVFSTLEGSVTGTSVFGALALVCLLLLIAPGRPKR